MTQSEFIATLKHAYNGRIDYESILHILSNYHMEKGTQYDNIGMESVASHNYEISTRLVERW